MKKLSLNEIDLEAYKFESDYYNPIKKIYAYDRFTCYHERSKTERLELIFVEKKALINESEEDDVVSFLRYCLSDLRFHDSFFWPDLYAYKTYIVFSSPLDKSSVIDLHNASQDFPEESISYICKELLQAIQFLHEKNILLTINGYGDGYVYADGSVKIDILHVVKSTAQILRRTSLNNTNVLYHCPESLSERTSCCMKTDIYVFGMALLVLLEGQPPKLYLDNHYLKYIFITMHQTDFPSLTRRDKWSTEMLKMLDSTATYSKRDRINASELLKSPLFNNCHTKNEFVKHSLQPLGLI